MDDLRVKCVYIILQRLNLALEIRRWRRESRIWSTKMETWNLAFEIGRWRCEISHFSYENGSLKSRILGRWCQTWKVSLLYKNTLNQSQLTWKVLVLYQKRLELDMATKGDVASKYPSTETDEEIVKKLKKLLDQRGCLIPGLRKVISLKKRNFTLHTHTEDYCFTSYQENCCK